MMSYKSQTEDLEGHDEHHEDGIHKCNSLKCKYNKQLKNWTYREVEMWLKNAVKLPADQMEIFCNDQFDGDSLELLDIRDFQEIGFSLESAQQIFKASIKLIQHLVENTENNN